MTDTPSNLDHQEPSHEEKLTIISDSITRHISDLESYAQSSWNEANTIKTHLDPSYASIINFDDVIGKIDFLQQYELSTLEQNISIHESQMLEETKGRLTELGISYELGNISSYNISTDTLKSAVENYKLAYIELTQKTKEIEDMNQLKEEKLREKSDLERATDKDEQRIQTLEDEIRDFERTLSSLDADKGFLESTLYTKNLDARTAASELISAIEYGPHRNIISEYENMQRNIQETLYPHA